MTTQEHKNGNEYVAPRITEVPVTVGHVLCGSYTGEGNDGQEEGW